MRYARDWLAHYFQFSESMHPQQRHCIKTKSGIHTIIGSLAPATSRTTRSRMASGSGEVKTPGPNASADRTMRSMCRSRNTTPEHGFAESEWAWDIKRHACCLRYFSLSAKSHTSWQVTMQSIHTLVWGVEHGLEKLEWRCIFHLLLHPFGRLVSALTCAVGHVGWATI